MAGLAAGYGGDVSERILIDNWELRRWLMWPGCAARGHPWSFWLPVAWNGIIGEQIGRCSCGRRHTRERVDPSITLEQYKRR